MIKEMPYREKYKEIASYLGFIEGFYLTFVQKYFGDKAVAELKQTWQKGTKPVPDNAAYEERYEITYANWVWEVKNTLSLVRLKLGAEGMKTFEREEVETLKRKSAGPGLHVLNFIRWFSPDTAFSMTTRKMCYQLQWLTPCSVPVLNRDRVVLDIPRCKILDYPDTEDMCVLCQSIYPRWAAEQFKVEVKWDRRGNSCTGTFRPLE